MSNFTHLKIEKDYKILKNQILKTPLIFSEYINNLTNAEIFFKLENLQWTGSFKLRGAMNKINKLTLEEKKEG